MKLDYMLKLIEQGWKPRYSADLNIAELKYSKGRHYIKLRPLEDNHPMYASSSVFGSCLFIKPWMGYTSIAPEVLEEQIFAYKTILEHRLAGLEAVYKEFATWFSKHPELSDVSFHLKRSAYYHFTAPLKLVIGYTLNDCRRAAVLKLCRQDGAIYLDRYFNELANEDFMTIIAQIKFSYTPANIDILKLKSLPGNRIPWSNI